MDPYGPPLTEPLTPQDKQLMNEVIFLHYLWHQGPPSTQFTPPTRPYSNPNPNPPNPYPQFPHIHHPQFPHPHPHSLSRNLGASNFPSFKRTKKNKSKGKRNRNSNAQQRDPGPDWPVDSPPPSPPLSASGWPSSNPNHDRKVSEPDNQKLAKIAAMHLQQKAAKRLKEFLAAADSDSTDEEKDEDDDNDGEEYFAGSVTDVEASEEYKFLLSAFVEDHELRELYERSQENAELICLACEAMGVKLGRTYKEAMGLARHALTITKTGRIMEHSTVVWKRCHRALGQVMCRVYGWDVSRYPVLLVTKEPLGFSLKNSGHQTQVECEPEGDADCIDNRTQDPDSRLESVSGNNGEVTCGERSSDQQNKSIVKTCEVGNDAIENPVVSMENIKEGTA